MLADAALKVCTAQILHDNVVGLAVLAPVIDRDNIRTGERCCSLSFLLKTGSKGRIVCVLRQHHLDGNSTTKNLVLSAVNGGHSTGTNFVLNLVTPTEHSTWHNSTPIKRAIFSPRHLLS